MFAPAVSPSPGPSSVQQWFLLHAVGIAALFAVASTSYSDICGTNFGNQMHTIGPIDGDLWAITKDNWTVYKLTPCKAANDSLVHCMDVGEPVSIDSKWPELAKSVKVAANKTDYNFTLDNSVIGYSSDFKDTVMAMYGDSFYDTGYFGFSFGANKSITTRPVAYKPPVNQGSWISSDVKGKILRILPSRNQSGQILFSIESESEMDIRSNVSSTQNICNVGTNDFQVNFTTQPCASPEKTFIFNVSRGVLYNKQFYLFGSDVVYIFLDKAEQTELVKLPYEAFFPCKPPTTLAPLTSSNQASNPSNESASTRPSATWTTTTGSNMGMIIGIVIICLLILLVLVGGYYFLVSKREKQEEQALSSKMAASSKVVSSGGKQTRSSAGASKRNFKMHSNAKSKTKLKVNSKATSKGNSNGKTKIRIVSKMPKQAFPSPDESEILQHITPMPTVEHLSQELPSVTPNPGDPPQQPFHLLIGYSASSAPKKGSRSGARKAKRSAAGKPAGRSGRRTPKTGSKGSGPRGSRSKQNGKAKTGRTSGHQSAAPSANSSQADSSAQSQPENKSSSASSAPKKDFRSGAARNSRRTPRN